MDNLILYFALKYNGNFESIYQALLNKEKIDYDLFLQLKKKLEYDYVTIFDDRYPQLLKKISCPPFILFYKGDWNMIENQCCTVLGSGTYSQSGITATHNIVSGLIRKTYTVISNCKLGLNQQVHSTAYNNNKKSICVLPYMDYGKDNQYQNHILEKCGLLLSERPFSDNIDFDDTLNMYRIMTGLSQNIVITECDLMDESDKEIVIAVGFALEQDKDIYCIPASVNKKRQGTNMLIQHGANLVINADDIGVGESI